MQGLTSPRRKGILCPSSVLVLLILPLGDLPSANGSCEFPASWAGEWYLHHQPTPVVINATFLGQRTCVERNEDMYIVYGEKCYHCMIINERHENVITYREGLCYTEQASVVEICSRMQSDEVLNSMFRMNAKSIPCPFTGNSFTFTYNKGHECTNPISLAEKCTDESKLLLKYQACTDVEGTESHTEELQCLAVWNEGRNKYLVGTLKGASALGTGKTYRCFLYEERTHHQGKVAYLLAQSGDPTCTGLTSLSEGAPTLKLTKVDKEHNRCKYPSWVTEHHDWHSLDGSKVYHFTNKNATLKVKVHDADSDGDPFHEEKIVCHNLEKFYPNDNTQGQKVKLVAHVTSGCDTGYVCMIFHKRDSHVIELQQSSQKAIMPDEACSLWDPSAMPHTTLITSVLHRRKCPSPGRYSILDVGPSLGGSVESRNRRSTKLSKPAERRTWQDEGEDEECQNTDVQVGCTSPDQNEMIIGNTCDREEMAYYCHGSWEERGTWYTIVSRKTVQPTVGLGEIFCFSMRSGSMAEKTKTRGNRGKLLEQEIWLSRAERSCRGESNEDWTYKLANQGVCEDVTKAYSSLASIFTLSRILLGFTIGSCIGYRLLLR